MLQMRVCSGTAKGQTNAKRLCDNMVQVLSCATKKAAILAAFFFCYLLHYNRLANFWPICYAFISHHKKQKNTSGLMPKYEELRENLYSGNEKADPVSAPLFYTLFNETVLLVLISRAILTQDFAVLHFKFSRISCDAGIRNTLIFAD